MSRKTKQEKIIADLRRKLKAQEKRLMVSPRPPSKTIEKVKTKARSQPVTDTFTVPTDLIKKDLMRTAILSIVAISLEFVVYFIWR